jgi:glyoxylate reductase
MKVVVTHPIPGPAVELLQGRGHEVIVGSKEEPYERDELFQLVEGADALLTLHYDPIGDELLDAAGEQLKIVANFGVGTDHIDLGAAAERGVRITNTPDVLNEAVAEETIALILAVARRLAEADRFVRARSDEYWHANLLIGRELKGKTLGIVGPGRIGTVTAKVAHDGLGMDVAYMDVDRNEELERGLDAERLELDELVERADVLAIHVPGSEETTHMIGREELERMKPDAILVNTARGDVVDEAALVAALRAGEIAGAGLDVFEAEPKPHEELLELDNVVLAPHIGSATEEARRAMSRLAAENIIALAEGRDLPSEVRTNEPPRSSA